MHHTRIICLISGNGTNLQALIEACASSTLPSTSIIHVISNRKSAYGLVRAQNASIPTKYHNLFHYKAQHPSDTPLARSTYDSDLATIVLAEKPDIVVCAGWMHILAPAFLDPVREAGVLVINLHPALPGEFNGANAIQRAQKEWLDGRIEKSGVMIHVVANEIDMGEPILVEEIPFITGVDEDLKKLEERIHRVE